MTKQNVLQIPEKYKGEQTVGITKWSSHYPGYKQMYSICLGWSEKEFNEKLLERLRQFSGLALVQRYDGVNAEFTNKCYATCGKLEDGSIDELELEKFLLS